LFKALLGRGKAPDDFVLYYDPDKRFEPLMDTNVEVFMNSFEGALEANESKRVTYLTSVIVIDFQWLNRAVQNDR
jgi:hypothetical protein